MPPTQTEKAETFRALHEGHAFVIPNPWDAGSARVFEALGFKALATTSSAFAFTLGRLDGGVTLDELAAHVRSLADATSIPISVDLENGYGPDPEHAATAITRAAEAGAVGGSIEDFDPEGHLYCLEHARRRASPRRARPPTNSASRSRSPPEPRTTSAATPTSTTRSPACRPTSARAPTSSTRPAFATATRSAPSPTRASKPLNVLAHTGLSMQEIAEAGGTRGQRRGRARGGSPSRRWRARRRRSGTPAASPRSTRSCRSRSGSAAADVSPRDLAPLTG